MYNNIGIHWASTVPAVLALVCVPMPILFMVFGPQIRERCVYAAESAEYMKKLEVPANRCH
jgi:hypothetical protein